MKKILICVITLVLIYIPKVHAEEIWTDIPKDGVANTEIRYRWYQEELIDNGYMKFIDNQNIVFNQLDYINEYSDWMEYNGEDILNIETRTIYQYKQLYPIRYIQIYDAINNDTDNIDFLIDEVKVYKNNSEINYDKKCSMCYQVTLDNIDDKTIENKFKMYTYNGYLLIDLLELYDIRDLSIEITLSQSGRFKIGFSKFKTHREMMSTYKEISVNTNESQSFIYKADETWITNFYYSDTKESEEKIEEGFDVQITPIEQFRTVNPLYHSYFINKKYYDNYYYVTSPNMSINLIKDENDFKVFYQYSNNINNNNNNNDNNNVTKVITKTNVVYKDSEPTIIYKTIKNDDNKAIIKESVPKREEITKTILKNETKEIIKTIKVNNKNEYYFILFIIIIFLLIIKFLVLRKMYFKK